MCIKIYEFRNSYPHTNEFLTSNILLQNRVFDDKHTAYKLWLYVFELVNRIFLIRKYGSNRFILKFIISIGIQYIITNCDKDKCFILNIFYTLLWFISYYSALDMIDIDRQLIRSFSSDKK